jgi:hypothetical protein
MAVPGAASSTKISQARRVNFQKAINLKSAEPRTLNALIKLALICSYMETFSLNALGVYHMEDEEVRETVKSWR